MRQELEELFMESEYSGLIDRIVSIVEGESNHKTIYLGSLKRFGRKKGVEVYKKLKQMI